MQPWKKQQTRIQDIYSFSGRKSQWKMPLWYPFPGPGQTEERGLPVRGGWAAGMEEASEDTSGNLTKEAVSYT